MEFHADSVAQTHHSKLKNTEINFDPFRSSIPCKALTAARAGVMKCSIRKLQKINDKKPAGG